MMKNFTFVKSAFLAMLFMGGGALMASTSTGNIQLEGSNDSINIAELATPSTSFVSGWESLAAVNDGFVPSNSNDRAHDIYGNWDSKDSYQWVQYEWAQSFIASSVEIYWFDDGGDGGVRVPDEAYIESYDNETSEWVRIVDMPAVKDQFNFVSLGELETTKLRVSMYRGDASTGIIEFRVWGSSLSGSTDFEAPSAPGKPEITAQSANSMTLAWAASTDNDIVAGYNILVNDSIIEVVDDEGAVLSDLMLNSHMMLAVQAMDSSGNLSSPSEGVWVFFGDDENAAKSYTWPTYSPTLNYNFKDEFPALEMPTKNLDVCPQVVGTQSSEWWTFQWGPNKRSEITEAAITPLLARLNQDFAYFRDTMGWPPDKRAKEGFRSTVYLYGSGLSCIDNADTTALGGWQSSVGGYACILASYYPIYSFDPSCPYSDREAQMGAMVHEGIHSVLADLPGAKNAAWFQEGGNTWLQQEAAARQTNDYSTMGFLNACPYIAPFMPIECYTGWLQDGTFGGPSAEGVNMFEDDQQICTWRRLLGGNQYGNTFPVFMGQILGKGSVAWVWRNCPDRVLEGMGDGIGDMQIRRMIMEYRAKQALIDMGEWSGAIKKLLDSNFKINIGAEWQPSWISPTVWKATPYVKTWMLDAENKILTPEPRTTPGWSGANQIPLNVSGSQAVVNFVPFGDNMTCQLCYRATDGTAVYSHPVSSGKCRLKMDKTAANGVVFAVICNTDYVYEGEETRMAHFDYRLQLVEGISGTASIYQKWYDYNSVISDVTDPVEDFPTEGATIYDDAAGIDVISNDGFHSKLYPNLIRPNESLNISFPSNSESEKEIRIFDSKGSVLYVMTGIKDKRFNLPIDGRLCSGVYFVNIQADNVNETQKFIIK